jgi:UDP:flavonoid glycosyltransferase YjiC (YdhE family)
LWREQEFLSYLNHAIEALGLGSIVHPDISVLLGDAYLLRTVKQLDPSPSSLPANVHLVGDCLWEPASTQPDFAIWLDRISTREEKLIYVHQARTFESPQFWSALMRLARDRKLSIASSTDRMPNCIDLSSEQMYLAPFVPQQLALQSSSLMVASGTTTPVLGALINKVPSVLIPTGGEQLDLAEQCRLAGCSFELSHLDVTDGQIYEALQQAYVNSNVRTSLEAVAADFYAVRQADVAIRVLEKLGHNSTPVTRDSMNRLC